MKLTAEDVKKAIAALEVSVWQISARSWKKRMEGVLSALRAGASAPEKDLDFALTVTYEGRLNYCGKSRSGEAWDAIMACLPVRDKVRGVVA